jgi:ParB/RepB/Spo0J family partition protein
MTAKAKLTEAQIAEIKALAAADPALTKREIARRFNVHHAQISRLLAGKAHAPTPPHPEQAPVGAVSKDPANPGPLAMIPWAKITPNVRNVRSILSEEDDAGREDAMALVNSILARGLLQPLRVMPIEREAITGAEFVLVDGHRRWRAMQILVGRKAIPANHLVPCFVAHRNTHPNVTMDQLAANLARRDMHPLDEADAYHHLVDTGRTTDEIGAAVGRTQRHVQSRLALGRRLTERAKTALRDGEISLAQAEALRDADDGQQMHVLSRLHRFPTEASIRDWLRPKPEPAPLPTVAEMMATTAAELMDAAASASSSVTPAKAGVQTDGAAGADSKRRSPDLSAPPPASDTAGAAFPPLRHFHVIAAAPDHDNMPKTLMLQNFIRGTRAHYTRIDQSETIEAEEAAP